MLRPLTLMLSKYANSLLNRKDLPKNKQTIISKRQVLLPAQSILLQSRSQKVN